MTQESQQFKKPVNNGSSGNSDDDKKEEQKGVFGGPVVKDFNNQNLEENNENIQNYQTKDDIHPDAPGVSSDSVHLDDSAMPDFGEPHDISSSNNNDLNFDLDNIVNEKVDDTELKNNDTKVNENEEVKNENNTELEKKAETNIGEQKKDNNFQKNVFDQKNVEVSKDTQVKESEIKKKFQKLFDEVNDICELKKIDNGELFEVTASDNDTVRLSYEFGLESDDIKIVVVKRLEDNLKTQEKNEDLLEFELDQDTNVVQLYLNDDLLFDEKKHLQNDNKAKMQVIEKMDKFLFLLGEYSKTLKKEIEENKKKEEERRGMVNLFKRF